MKKFVYYTIDIKPSDLELELHERGQEGWELVNVIVLQRMIESSVMKLMSSPQGTIPQMEIRLQLIFKAETT